mmetsp:Transcript_18513/g.49657  ORF Transcript_18513/g.49657 Transcript_18513/m.49657 type:complete len:288 (-) Transcript_18513:84-947(-)
MFDDDVLDEMDILDASKHPVLVGWYSGGFYKEEGRGLLKDIMETAKEYGMRDTLVLDHPDEYNMEGEGYEPYRRYVDVLIERIDEDPERTGRPLLLFGHSRGACAAMAVATRLGARVLKVYIVATGAMVPDQPSGWEQMSLAFKKGGDELILGWLLSMQPGNLVLARAFEAAKANDGTLQAMYSESKWLTSMVTLTRRQYREAMYPDMTKDVQVLSIPLCAVSPLQDPSTQPEHNAGWNLMTTAECEQLTVDAGHMDVLKAKKKKGHRKEFPLGDLLGPNFAQFVPH